MKLAKVHNEDVAVVGVAQWCAVQCGTVLRNTVVLCFAFLGDNRKLKNVLVD